MLGRGDAIPLLVWGLHLVIASISVVPWYYLEENPIARLIGPVFLVGAAVFGLLAASYGLLLGFGFISRTPAHSTVTSDQGQPVPWYVWLLGVVLAMVFFLLALTVMCTNFGWGPEREKDVQYLFDSGPPVIARLAKHARLLGAVALGWCGLDILAILLAWHIR